jgi:hypothetical protein
MVVEEARQRFVRYYSRRFDPAEIEESDRKLEEHA